MQNMLKRAIRAALLNRTVFREVADDPGTVLHAAGVVVLVGIALSLALTGGFLGDAAKPPDLSSLGNRLVLGWLAIMTMLVGWVLWAGVAYLLASRFLGGRGGFRGTLRALGICYGPGVLLVLTPVQPIGNPASIIALLWILVVAVVAVHEVQELDWIGTAMSTFLGWILALLVLPSVVLVGQSA